MSNKPTRLDRRFGRELHTFLYRPSVFSLLGDEGTWSAGGCWILADALRKWIGPRAVLRMIASDRSASEHVVVELDGQFIHAAGVVTLEELLEEMRREEGLPHPRLVPFDSTILRSNGVPGPEPASELLLQKLKRRFGSSLA